MKIEISKQSLKQNEDIYSAHWDINPPPLKTHTPLPSSQATPFLGKFFILHHILSFKSN